MAKFEKWHEAWKTAKQRSQRKAYYRQLCELADGKTDNLSAPSKDSSLRRLVETPKVVFEKPEKKAERDAKTEAPETFLNELKKLKEVRDALSKPLRFLRKYSAEEAPMPDMLTDELYKRLKKINEYLKELGELKSNKEFPLQGTNTIKNFIQGQLELLKQAKAKMDGAIEGKGSIPAKKLQKDMDIVLEHLIPSDKSTDKDCPDTLKKLKRFVQMSTQEGSIYKEFHLEKLQDKLNKVSMEIQDKIDEQEQEQQEIKKICNDITKYFEDHKVDIVKIKEITHWKEIRNNLHEILRNECNKIKESSTSENRELKTKLSNQFEQCKKYLTTRLDFEKSVKDINTTFDKTLDQADSHYASPDNKEKLQKILDKANNLLKDPDATTQQLQEESDQIYKDVLKVLLENDGTKLEKMKNKYNENKSWLKTLEDLKGGYKDYNLYNENFTNLSQRAKHALTNEATTQSIKDFIPELVTCNIALTEAFKKLDEIIHLKDKDTEFCGCVTAFEAMLRYLPIVPPELAESFRNAYIKACVKDHFASWYNPDEKLQEQLDIKTINIGFGEYLTARDSPGLISKSIEIFLQIRERELLTCFDPQEVIEQTFEDKVKKAEQEILTIRVVLQDLQLRYPDANPVIVENLATAAYMLMKPNEQYCFDIIKNLQEEMRTQGLSLDEILQKYEEKRGFEKREVVFRALKPQEFMQRVSQGRLTRDVGVAIEHGPNIHRMQWYIIGNLCEEGIIKMQAVELYKAIADGETFCNKPKDCIGQNQTVWDRFLDHTTSSAFTDPFYAPKHFIENLPVGPLKVELQLTYLQQTHFGAASVDDEKSLLEGVRERIIYLEKMVWREDAKKLYPSLNQWRLDEIMGESIQQKLEKLKLELEQIKNLSKLEERYTICGKYIDKFTEIYNREDFKQVGQYKNDKDRILQGETVIKLTGRA